uniref:J domain-containing protein n=1 Tax=Clastoptera arizonana TaxID=38151 RepID=A0A1B6D1F7_9HEMI
MDFVCKRILTKLLLRNNHPIGNILRSNYYFYQCNKKLNNLVSLNASKELYFNIYSTLSNHIVKNMCIVTSLTKNCWKCGEELKHILVFCDKCNSFQKMNTVINYFEIFGIENYNYDINRLELSQRYRKIQSILHPDRFMNKTKEEIQMSEDYSALVNKAYFILLDPLERGLYMLHLNGEQISEDSGHMDNHFLMKIMDINEEIENETDPNKLLNLYETNKTVLDKLSKEVNDAFEKCDITAAKEKLTKMKYYSSIQEKLKELKQKLAIPD